MQNPSFASDLRALADQIETNPLVGADTGHINLMSDLVEVWKEAFEFQYHDFKNNKYETPKVQLAHQFQVMAENTKNGRYDN